MSLKSKHFFIAFFSLLLFLATLFVPVKVENSKQMEDVKLGYPLHFISQDFYKNNEGFLFFPHYQIFEIKKISEIKNFSVINFIISSVAFFLSLEALIYILETINFKIRNYFHKEN